MNVRLLRRIQRIILKRPKQIRMRTWFSSDPKVGHCGTTGCIAGWAVTLDEFGKPMPLLGLEKFGSGPFYAPFRARKVLNLTKAQSDRLFFSEQWPDQFLEKIIKHGEGTVGYAKTVAARISHFIKTKGAE